MSNRPPDRAADDDPIDLNQSRKNEEDDYEYLNKSNISGSGKNKSRIGRTPSSGGRGNKS